MKSIVISCCLLYLPFVMTACKNSEKGLQESFQKLLGVKPGNSSFSTISSTQGKVVTPSQDDLLSQKNSIKSCPEDSILFGKAYPLGKSQWCAYKDKAGVEVKHGEFRHWHQNGEVKALSNYQDGELEGEYREWYEDKKLKEVTRYSKGRKNGKSITYTKEGKPFVEAQYVNDELTGQYSKFSRFGKPIEKGNYIAGQKTGLWELYDNYGVIKEKTEFQAGLKHGKTNRYRGNEILIASGFYDRDQEIGHWIYYDNKGFKNSEGNLVQGKKHGRWVDYDKSGQPFRISFYDFGRRGDSYKVAANTIGTTQSFGSKDILGAEPPRRIGSVRNDLSQKPTKSERPKPLTKEGWAPL